MGNMRQCAACGNSFLAPVGQRLDNATCSAACRMRIHTDRSGGPDACWPWLALRNRKGYGYVRYEGQMAIASRVAWILCHGPIPNGVQVMHRCDNPPCCNPSHLALGTNKDNSDDMMRKGRHRLRPPFGEAHWCAKLSLADVAAIREQRTRGVPISQVAAAFGVSESTVSEVANGKRWRHVSSAGA